MKLNNSFVLPIRGAISKEITQLEQSGTYQQLIGHSKTLARIYSIQGSDPIVERRPGEKPVEHTHHDLYRFLWFSGLTHGLLAVTLVDPPGIPMTDLIPF